MTTSQIMHVFHGRPRDEDVQAQVQDWLRANGRNPDEVAACWQLKDGLETFLVTHEYVYDDQHQLIVVDGGREVAMAEIRTPLIKEFAL